MSFNGNEGAIITLEKGSEMTARFRRTISTGYTLGQFIGSNLLNRILAQENCVGIRFYYALDENNKKNLVCVGVDANENDLYEGIVADEFQRCPPHSSNSNPLNS